MSGVTGVAEVDTNIQQWLEWDQNDVTRAEIQALVDEKKGVELKKRFGSRLAFGTAGLRARMGAGYSMMNDLTIIQTTQGLLKYALTVCPEFHKRGVVVGFDARHNSSKWAKLTAGIFLAAGVRVHLYSKITPTPFVPYGVLQYGADVGIMVTASHNPKEDNGYKVYWSNGAQIIPPHDSGIAASILSHLEPWTESWDLTLADSSTLRQDPYSEVMVNYFTDMKYLSKLSAENAKTPLRFTYTAMHGVGYEFAVKSMETFNFSPPIPVVEQVTPDPEFPTVKYPNPEEGKSALDLSMKTADENCSTIILANDPDADRLAVAEKQPNGQWKVFSGNELGALFGWWMLESYKITNPKVDGSQLCMLSSTVSSMILRSIARVEGIHFEDTLTGFKWMGNRAHELLQQGKTVLFAFEEAIGFMCGTKVLDKDGISALSCISELAVYLNLCHLTLTQQLNNIYQKYGSHVSSNSYYICHEPSVITDMFTRLRNFTQDNQYPSSLGRFTISNVRDLTTGYDDNHPDKKARLPVSSSSQMITFYLSNGCVMTLRTSGTEPKIKYYTEYIADPSKGLTAEGARAELKEIVELMAEHFFQPQKNNLVKQSA